MAAMNKPSPSSQPLSGRHILLGVTGGIAAYKCAELVRRLVETGAEVQVVMTTGAQKFITPLTLQAVSGRPVRSSLWDQSAELGMGHIELARWAELVLIAPATADTLARLVHGRADDLLNTLCLATEAPLMLAPAMNHVMWTQPATQTNCQTLSQRGAKIIGPAEGELAERETGAGRMLEPAEIRDHVISHFGGGLLGGQRVVITAGPTRESLDPVRFLSNRSTGRMGYAVAAACAAAGADVVLISGPTGLTTPPATTRVDVETAAQMLDVVNKYIADADIFIATAAVADYRPQAIAEQKIKKSDGDLSLTLSRTTDILAHVAQSRPDLFTVGFAAETQDMQARARGKLGHKKLNMVAGNEVGEKLAFGQSDNSLYVCWPGGETHLQKAKKPELARQLVALIAQQYKEQAKTHAQAASQNSR